MMEAVSTSETSVILDETTWRNREFVDQKKISELTDENCTMEIVGCI
jgi:hypothetical protein